jgi:hypothetical protein
MSCLAAVRCHEFRLGGLNIYGEFRLLQLMSHKLLSDIAPCISFVRAANDDS